MRRYSESRVARLLWVLCLCGFASAAIIGGSLENVDLSFQAEPKDALVNRDASVVFDCALPEAWNDRKPAPIVEWKRDGLPINFIGDSRSILTNGSLRILTNRHHHRPDEGIYQCFAKLPGIGTIMSKPAKLQLPQLGKFISEPRDITVRVGNTARFNCSLQGSTAARISWLKNDQPLFVDESRMLVLPSGALEIEEVELGDQGYYQCNASAAGTFKLSAPAKLGVHSELEDGVRSEAPFFIAVPRDTVAPEGSTVILECAANGNPRPEVMWLKDGTTIDLALLDNARFRRLGSGNLEISQLAEEDSGVYQCRAENQEDSSDVSAALEVQVAPKLTKKPQTVVAHEKEDAELECQFYGKPEPMVEWFKNGEPIRTSEYFQYVNGHNLRILGLVSDDSGIYQCVGSNAAGIVQAAAQLIVQPDSVDGVTEDSVTRSGRSEAVESTPHFDVTSTGSATENDVPSAPLDVEPLIVSSRFVTLRWKEPVKTNGEILGYSVYYRQDGSERERVVNTSRSRVEEVNVPGLQPGRKYSLRVVAFNEKGPGESSPILILETQAEPHVLSSPTNYTVIPLSSVSLLARWNPPENWESFSMIRYKLFYMETGSAEEHEVVVMETSHVIHALKPYTEYSVWVVAFNENGPGTGTEEVTVRTYSDSPTDVPQSVTAEPASSTSVIVRWEPPAKDHQNGIITGYKIRYKPKGRGRPLPGTGSTGSTATTDGSRRLFQLTGLQRGTEYQIRVSALTVNGSGPFTDWISVETFENDLDETQVPDPPSSLRARPMTNSISVSWNPPSNQNIMVRGYTIGWGKGIPDVYTKLVDGKQRIFLIDKLEANSEYVISLRAYNQMGDGRPIYETVRTREEVSPEPLNPLIPPVGLKAIVLSSTTVVVYWTDTTIPRNQAVTDTRYYIVRYTSSHTSSNPRYRYLNSTEMNCMLDDLRPNTQYEFAVKVVKNRRESPWSLVVTNTTLESAPASAPRDLTIVPVEDNPTAVNLNWQPPKQSNGQITGYVISYTTDNTQRDRDWVVEGVVGDTMTTTIKGLTPDTNYYFKILARNNKGYGPLSSPVIFRTNPSNGLSYNDSSANHRDGRGISSTTLYIILGVAAGIIMILLIVVVIVVFRKRDGSATTSPDRSKKGYIKGTPKGKLGKADNPPDLWIHHDQMEMKGMDKSQRCNSVSTVSPLPRRSQDFDSLDEVGNPVSTAGDSIDRRAAYVTAYAGGSTNSLRRSSKPRSLLISVASQQPPREPVATALPIPNGSINQHSDTRPVFPRPGVAYNTPGGSGRAHVTIDAAGQPPEVTYPLLKSQPPESNYSTQSSSYDSRSSLIAPSAAQTAGGGPPPPPSSEVKRSNAHGHPLKSFTSVPAPPPPAAPTNQLTPGRPTNQSSPYKKGCAPPSTGLATAGNSHAPRNDLRPPPVTLQTSYSTEELNQEMANLEGLMKDLNAITASDFGC